MYINRHLSICCIKPDYEETRELTSDEIALILRDYGYKATYEEIIDISQTAEYQAAELEKARKIKIAENQSVYEAKLKEGLVYNGIKYDCDDRALLRISAQAIDNQLTNRTEPLIWFDYDYNPQTLTIEEFAGLCNSIKTITTSIESKNCELNIAINNAQTFEELGAILIDYTNI